MVLVRFIISSDLTVRGNSVSANNMNLTPFQEERRQMGW